MRIKEIRKIFLENFEEKHKKVCVELVHYGFLNYKKLTPKNYDFWWYEVDALKETIRKKKFTFDFSDLEKTKKYEILKELISYHKDSDNIYALIYKTLNIIAMIEDGFTKEEAINFYYPKKNIEQMQFDFE